jgi:phosphatidylserine decarboxylase
MSIKETGLWKNLSVKFLGEKNSMKIAQGCKSWIIIPFLIGIFFVFLVLVFKELISSVFLFVSVILFLLTILFIVFFRDPDRETGKGIVAVADGKIQDTDRLKDKDVGDCIRISTFMNVYNVHVNRMPFDGVVKDVVHIAGSYLPAFKKESEKNERMILTIDTNIGTLKVVQIAGFLARRIISYVKKGDKVKKGEKIGMIRFGSRVDLYLPSDKIKLRIKIGDRVKAGEDVVAEVDA